MLIFFLGSFPNSTVTHTACSPSKTDEHFVACDRREGRDGCFYLGMERFVQTGAGTSLLFLEARCHSLGNNVSSLRYSLGSPPFPHKSSGVSKALCAFSFLPLIRRDFPVNVRSGGCDSLTRGRTSKQRDSLLSYALRFLLMRSHQICCAGGKSRGKPSADKPIPPPPPF